MNCSKVTKGLLSICTQREILSAKDGLFGNFMILGLVSAPGDLVSFPNCFQVRVGAGIFLRLLKGQI